MCPSLLNAKPKTFYIVALTPHKVQDKWPIEKSLLLSSPLVSKTLLTRTPIDTLVASSIADATQLASTPMLADVDFAGRYKFTSRLSGSLLHPPSPPQTFKEPGQPPISHASLIQNLGSSSDNYFGVPGNVFHVTFYPHVSVCPKYNTETDFRGNPNLINNAASDARTINDKFLTANFIDGDFAHFLDKNHLNYYCTYINGPSQWCNVNVNFARTRSTEY
ncbi:hypothetical protein C0995_010061 [Termitomyces sp. Mi166|nr:hypothetical protein C0995_010061 [Termitomyces sp. Mi166\